jgi:transcriptional regulator with XRE-family HTH domain
MMSADVKRWVAKVGRRGASYQRVSVRWQRFTMATAANEGDDPTGAGPGDDAAESRSAAAHLARNLGGLRHARQLTQEALARAAAVPRSTIANLESGAGNPSLVVLVKVAHALGVPIDELLASPRAKVRRWPAADVAFRVKGRGVTHPRPRPRAGARRDDGGARLRARRGDGRHPAPAGNARVLHLPRRPRQSDRRRRAPCPRDGDVLAFPGNLPHSYQNADALAPARGISVVVLAKAGV